LPSELKSFACRLALHLACHGPDFFLSLAVFGARSGAMTIRFRGRRIEQLIEPGKVFSSPNPPTY
jgi:hypothetical protein